MGTSRFGQLLLVIGGGVGVAAVVGLVVGFEPAALPPALVNIAVYKLTFAAAAGLLAAGAIVRRYARRSASGRISDSEDSVEAEGERAALGEGLPNTVKSAREQQESVRVRDRP
jgi:hypothetical protein